MLKWKIKTGIKIYKWELYEYKKIIISKYGNII
jgi:hypothetical protein